MVHPAKNYGFRVNERFHGKALLDDKGIPFSRAVTQLWDRSLAPFGRGCLRPQTSFPPIVNNKWQRRTTMLSKVRLAMNADSHAELAIISWMNH